jgi:NAD(P)-dependent dehydrogenase (short-subunit alcohol dehydrogenase family)
MGKLDRRRILLVGASSGIGRAAAGVLCSEGARVAALARREPRLEALAAEFGDALTPIVCDVREESVCAQAVARAEAALGGLDALVYCAGIAPLTPLRDAGASVWRDAFETNVVGAALVTRAALPALTLSHGRAVYLSSISAGEQPPRAGLGLYVASKAALDRMVAVWEIEQPEVGFTRVSVGDTFPSEIASGWDPEAAALYLDQWNRRGLLFGRTLDANDVAQHLVDLLAMREAVPVSSVTPRYPLPIERVAPARHPVRLRPACFAACRRPTRRRHR